MPSKSQVLTELQKEIMLLQGFKPANASTRDTGLGIIQHSFPNNCFPLGALHEFISNGQEESTAAFGFISGIAGSLAQGAPIAWVSTSKQIYPPGLAVFGVEPHHILFIQAKKPKDVLWVLEEALKTESLAAVVGAVSDLSFNESRRLQLAVEQSKVTGFLVRQHPKNATTACAARWQITAVPSLLDELPGIGFPRWQVQLLKVRNGKPGSWQVAWRNGKFEVLPEQTIVEKLRKVV